jgi:hypothetical protein
MQCRHLAIILLCLAISPTSLASQAVSPGRVIGSAKLVIPASSTERPQVTLQLPATFKRGSSSAAHTLDRFRSEIIAAFDVGLNEQRAMGMPLHAYNPPGVREQATILLYGTGPGQAQVQFGYPKPPTSQAGDTPVQVQRFRSDIITALDGALTKLGWRR